MQNHRNRRPSNLEFLNSSSKVEVDSHRCRPNSTCLRVNSSSFVRSQMHTPTKARNTPTFQRGNFSTTLLRRSMMSPSGQCCYCSLLARGTVTRSRALAYKMVGSYTDKLSGKDRDLRRESLLLPDHEAKRCIGELVGLTQLVLQIFQIGGGDVFREKTEVGS